MLGFGPLASAPYASGSGSSRVLAADWWDFTYTGNPADLITTYALTAQGVSYGLSGNAAVLTADRSLSAAKGTYTQTKQAATLRAARMLPLATAAYAVTGNLAGLSRGMRLSAAKRSFTLTGNAVTLRAGRRLPLATRAFAVSGFSTEWVKTRFFDLDPGQMEVTPGVAQLTHGLWLRPISGGYSLSFKLPRIYISSFFYDDNEIIPVPWENASILIAGKVQYTSDAEIICVPWQDYSVMVPLENRTITLVADDPVEELFDDRSLDAEARLRATN